MTIVLTLLLSSFWVASAQSLSPAPVTGATATYTVCSAARLTWELSVHDNPDSAGVTGYTINLGTSAGAEDFELLATVPAGTTTYLVEFSQLPNAPSFVFRIDTFRDEEVSLGSVTGVTLLLVRLSHTDADGNPVYILVPDGATPFTEDFEDFLALAFAFWLHAI